MTKQGYKETIRKLREELKEARGLVKWSEKYMVDLEDAYNKLNAENKGLEQDIEQLAQRHNNELSVRRWRRCAFILMGLLTVLFVKDWLIIIWRCV